MWEKTGGDPRKGKIAFRRCSDGADNNQDGMVFVPDGQQQPQVDPATLAYRAVDSMNLKWPRVLSPKADGNYVVGMPMWLQVAETKIAGAFGKTLNADQILKMNQYSQLGKVPPSE